MSQRGKHGSPRLCRLARLRLGSPIPCLVPRSSDFRSALYLSISGRRRAKIVSWSFQRIIDACAASLITTSTERYMAPIVMPWTKPHWEQGKSLALCPAGPICRRHRDRD